MEAVPTRETTPAFAQASDEGDAPAEYEPVSPDESLDHGDPDWSEPEAAAASNGDSGKPTPEWAQTVHTDPGQTIPAELSEELEESARSVESETEPEAKEEPAPEAEPAAEDEPDEPAIAATCRPPPRSRPVAARSRNLQSPRRSRNLRSPPRPRNSPPRQSHPGLSRQTPPSRPHRQARQRRRRPRKPTSGRRAAHRAHDARVAPPPELEEPATRPGDPQLARFLRCGDACGARRIGGGTGADGEGPRDQIHHPSGRDAAHGASRRAEGRGAARAPRRGAARRGAAQDTGRTGRPARASRSGAHRAASVAIAARPSVAAGVGAARPAGAARRRDPAEDDQPKGAHERSCLAPRVPRVRARDPDLVLNEEQVRHTAARRRRSRRPPSSLGSWRLDRGWPAAGRACPPAPQPAAAQPAAQPTAKPTWEVVQAPKTEKASQGPTPEDRSYAEWFAWAKRGGAPASACHAAAQGAFKALAAGKDVQTAVQWATAAMARTPENVSYTRQTYCAWFSLANIDLNLDQHRAHAFAMAAVHALDNGQDASQAHAAGLVAAGIR